MATFKDSYRLERVYFEKLKSMISILKSFLENETDEKTRAILENEIDDNGAILLLYRNLGEAWAELADLIQKLRNDLTDLDEKEEAYHDELNERIDEVNNYLMALIRALEARMDAVEADLAQMGRLFTYDLTETSGVYSLTESGASVTFADTVTKLTHVRPHFVSVRNGSKYYLIDTYDLTAATGSVTWSGFEFTLAGEIKETIVTLAADNSVTVTQTSTNFAAILSRLTAIETKITNFGDLPANANASVGDVLMVGNNHLNVWGKAASVIYLDASWNEDDLTTVDITLNGDPINISTVYNYLAAGNIVKVRLNSFFNGQISSYYTPAIPRILDVAYFKATTENDETEYLINWNLSIHPHDNLYYDAGFKDALIDLYVLTWEGTDEDPYAYVTYRNMSGIDFILSGTAGLEGAIFNQILGLTLKERVYLYGRPINLFVGFVRYYVPATQKTYQLPLLTYDSDILTSPTDPDKSQFVCNLTFYNPQTSTTINLEWTYDEGADTETIVLI